MTKLKHDEKKHSPCEFEVSFYPAQRRIDLKLIEPRLLRPTMLYIFELVINLLNGLIFLVFHTDKH